MSRIWRVKEEENDGEEKGGDVWCVITSGIIICCYCLRCWSYQNQGLSLPLSLLSSCFLSRILFFGVLIFNRRLLKLSHKVVCFFLINDSSKLIGCLPRVFLRSNFCCVFDCFLPIFFFKVHCLKCVGFGHSLVRQ